MRDAHLVIANFDINPAVTRPKNHTSLAHVFANTDLDLQNSTMSAYKITSTSTSVAASGAGSSSLSSGKRERAMPAVRCDGSTVMA